MAMGKYRCGQAVVVAAALAFFIVLLFLLPVPASAAELQPEEQEILNTGGELPEEEVFGDAGFLVPGDTPDVPGDANLTPAGAGQDPGAEGDSVLEPLSGGVPWGYLFHVLTKAPISDATVTLDSGESATTGSDGGFSFSGTPPESFAIMISAGGADIGTLTVTGGSYIYITPGVDELIISANLIVPGKDIYIVGKNITVADGVIISTRQIGSGSHLDGSSTGHSGSITLKAQSITIGERAALLAHVEDGSGFSAGDITFHAEHIVTPPEAEPENGGNLEESSSGLGDDGGCSGECNSVDSDPDSEDNGIEEGSAGSGDGVSLEMSQEGDGSPGSGIVTPPEAEPENGGNLEESSSGLGDDGGCSGECNSVDGDPDSEDNGIEEGPAGSGDGVSFEMSQEGDGSPGSGDDLITPVGNGGGDGIITDRAEASIEIQSGAALKGGNIRIAARAEAGSAPVSEEMLKLSEIFVKALAETIDDPEDGFKGFLNLFALEKIALSSIIIRENVEITAIGDVMIKAEARADGTLKTGYTILSAGYSRAEAKAEIEIGGGAAIGAGGGIEILSNAGAIAGVEAKTQLDLGPLPDDLAYISAAFAMVETHLESHVLINQDAILEAGKNITVSAAGSSKNDATAEAGMYENGMAGAAVALSFKEADVRAKVYGWLTAGGKDAEPDPETGKRDPAGIVILAVLDSEDNITVTTSKDEDEDEDEENGENGAGAAASFNENEASYLESLWDRELLEYMIGFLTAVFTGDSAGGNEDISSLNSEDNKAEENKDKGEKSDSGISETLGIAVSFAFMKVDNTVEALVGPQAVLRSDLDIAVSARVTERFKISCQSSVDKSGDDDDNSDEGGASALQEEGGDNGGDSGGSLAVSVAASVAFLGNTAQATVEGGAQLDASRETLVRAQVAYPYLVPPKEVLEGLLDVSKDLNKLWEEIQDLEEFNGLDDIKDALQAVLKDKLNLIGSLINTWVRSTASAETVGIAGAVSYLQLNNLSEAVVKNGARINQDENYRTPAQSVTVEAALLQQMVNITGIFDFDIFVGEDDELSMPSPIGEAGGKAGVGGSGLLVFITGDTLATVEDGAAVSCGEDGKITVKADARTEHFSFAMSGNEAEKLVIGGTFTLIEQTGGTKALVGGGAFLSGGSLLIDAEDNTSHINIVGNLIKGESAGIGASVAINNITRTVLAGIGNAEGDPAGLGSISISGDIKIKAEAGGAIYAFSLAGTLVKESSDDNKEQDTGDKTSGAPPSGDTGSGKQGASSQEYPASVSPASNGGGNGNGNGGGQGSFGLGVSGDVAINTIRDDVVAYIQFLGKLNARELALESQNHTSVISASGSAAIVKTGGTSIGIAGSYSQNTLRGTTRASVNGANLDARKLTASAERKGNLWAVSAGGAGAPGDDGYAVAGSVSVNIIENNTEASIEDIEGSVSGQIRIKASDNSTIFVIAGALGYGGKAGFGTAVAYNDIDNTTRAVLEGSELAAAAGPLTLEAQGKNYILAVVGSLGASKDTAGISGTVAINRIESVVEAEISGSEHRGGAVSLLAKDTSEILSIAGSIGGAEKVGFGAAVAWNEIESSVRVVVMNSTLLTTGTLLMEAVAEGRIITVAIGAAGAKNLALAGSACLNSITSSVESSIRGSTVEADAGVALRAHNRAEIAAIAGAVGGAREKAVGAAVAVNSIGGGLKEDPAETRSSIENSRVVAGDGAIALAALSEAVIKSITATGSFSGDYAANGSVSVNFIYTLVEAFIRDCTDEDDPDRTMIFAAKGITLDAADNSAVSVIAGNVAGSGEVSAGAAVALVFIGRTPAEKRYEMFLNLGEYVADDNPEGDIDDEAYKYGEPEFLSGSGVGAFIINSKVSSGEGVSLTATASPVIFNIAAGAAVGGKGGLQGSVAVNFIYCNTAAQIVGAVVTAKGDIAIKALSLERIEIPASALSLGPASDTVGIFDGGGGTEDEDGNPAVHRVTAIQSLAGQAAGGGKAGIGVAVAVNNIANTFEAAIISSTVESLQGSVILVADSRAGVKTISAALIGSGKLGFAGAVSVNLINNGVLAYIEGSSVNASPVGTGTIEGYNPGVIVIARDSAGIFSVSGQINFTGTGGIGAAAAYNEIGSGAKAYIDTSTVATPAYLTIVSATEAELLTLAVGGGVSGKFSGNGSVAINTINNHVSSYILNSEAEADSAVGLSASDRSKIGSIAGAFSGSGTAAIGGAVAVNMIGGIQGFSAGPQQVYAYIENSRVVSREGSITLSASSDAVIKSISAAGGFSGKVALNGAVSINWIYTDIAAYITGSTSEASGDITLSAADSSAVSVIAGDISGSGLLSAGASVAIVFIGDGLMCIEGLIANEVFEEHPYEEIMGGYKQKDDHSGDTSGGLPDEEYGYDDPRFLDTGNVRTYIRNSRVISDQGSVLLESNAEIVVFNISAGFAVGGKAGAYRGSASVNYIHSAVTALIQDSIVTVHEDISLTAASPHRGRIPLGALQVPWDDNPVESHEFQRYGQYTEDGEYVEAGPKSPGRITSIQALAGSISGGLTAALGASVAVNHIENSYCAAVTGSEVAAGGDFILFSESGAGIDSISAAIAASIGIKTFPFAGAAALSLNWIESETASFISGSSLEAKNILIEARDTAVINSIAGQVGASFGVIMVGPVPVPTGTAFGAAFAYNEINNTVTVFIANSPDVDAAGNLIMEAASDAEINSIAAGGSMSAWAGVSATVTINKVNNLVEAYISDSKVAAVHNIYILAASDTTINSYGGSAGAGALGVGAAAVVNIIEDTTRAFIEDSEVTASGSGAPVQVKSWDDAGSESSEPIKGLAVIAGNRVAITVYSGGAAVGSIAWAGQVSVNIISNTTEAYITGSQINSPADPGRTIAVRAFQDTGARIYTGSLAVGGAAALGGAVDTTFINNLTRAYIDSSVIYALDGVEVWALTNYAPLDDGGPSIVIAGASGFGMVSVAGAVSVMIMENENEAAILRSSIYSPGGPIRVHSHHNAAADVYAGTASVTTGFVGAGGSVVVSSFKNSSRARVKGSNLNAGGAIEVKARSRDNIRVRAGTAAVAAGGGVAGAVTVTLIETTTEASVEGDGDSDSHINQDPRFGPGGAYAPGTGQRVFIRADNESSVKSVDGALGAGIAVIGASIDYISIQNRTVAMVGAGTKIYARGDIAIEAESNKVVSSNVYSFGGGLFGITGAVSIVNIGAPIDADGAEEFNAELRGQLDDDLSPESLLYYKVGENKKNRLPGFGTAASANLAVAGIGLPDLNRALDPHLDTSTKITAAFIQNGGGTVSPVEMVSGGELKIQAVNRIDIVSIPNNAVLGGFTAGGTVARVTTREKTWAYVGDYGYIRAGSLEVSAQSFDTVVVECRAAAAALIGGVNIYLARAEVKPVVRAFLGSHTDIVAAESIEVGAEVTPKVSAEVIGITATGGITVGFCQAEALVSPDVAAWVGDYARIISAPQPVSGNPTLTLINRGELAGAPGLEFRGYTIVIEGEFTFIRGVAMSGQPDLVFQGPVIVEGEFTFIRGNVSMSGTPQLEFRNTEESTIYNGSYTFARGEDGSHDTLTAISNDPGWWEANNIAVGDWVQVYRDPFYQSGTYQVIAIDGLTLTLHTRGEVDNRAVYNAWLFRQRPPSITRSEGSWIGDGFAPGQVITVFGTSFNNREYTISSSISEKKILLGPFDYLEPETIADSTGVTIKTSLDYDALRREDAPAGWSWQGDGIETGDAITILIPGDGTNSGDYLVREILADGTLLLDSQGRVVDAYAVAAAVKKPSTITRSAGSWLADGFAPGQIIEITGTWENDGVYEIASISADGRVIYLAAGYELVDEMADGSRKVTVLDGNFVLEIDADGFLVLRRTDAGPGWNWADENLQVGDFVRLPADREELYYRIVAVSGNSLTLIPVVSGALDDQPGNSFQIVDMEEFDRVTLERLPRQIEVVAGGMLGYDRLIYTGGGSGWSFTGQGIKGDDYLTVITAGVGHNSGVYRVIGFEDEGRTAILDTAGYVQSRIESGTIAFKEIPSEITRGEGSWIADGFAPGQLIEISGTGHNDGYYEILEISGDGKTLRLFRGYELTDEDIPAGSAVSIISYTPDRIVRDTGSWLEDGFAPGQYIRVAGSALNDGIYRVTAVSADGKELILNVQGVLNKETSASLVITLEGDTGSFINITARHRLPDFGAGKTAIARAAGISVGVASGSGTVADAAVNPVVKAYVGSQSYLNTSGAIYISALTMTRQEAYTDAVNFGAVTIDINSAAVSSASDTAAYTGNNAVLKAGYVGLSASGSEYGYAQALAGSIGAANYLAAKARTVNESTTRSAIGSGTQIDAGQFSLIAYHGAAYNSRVDTINASLVGYSGALAENKVDAVVEAAIGTNAEISAFDIVVLADNQSRKDMLAVPNVNSGSGGIFDLPAARSLTGITHQTAITVGDGARLHVSGDPMAPGSLTLAALNSVTAIDRVKLAAGGAIAVATGVSEVKAGTKAVVTVDRGAALDSVGDINLTALSVSNIDTRADVETWGGASAASGRSLSELNAENRVTVREHARLFSEGHVNLMAGKDSLGNTNNLNAVAFTHINNKGIAPVYTNPRADGVINLHSYITVERHALIESVGDTNLIAEKGPTTASGNATGKDWVRSIVGAEIKGGTGAYSSSPVVRVDGSIVVGLRCQQVLMIDVDGNVVEISEGITITREKVILAEHLLSEIHKLNRLAVEYAGTEAGAAFAAQARFLERELELMGYNIKSGEPLPIVWVDLIIVGSIKAGQANINVLAENGSFIGTGTLKAPKDAALIKIINESPAYLLLDSLYIPENQGGMLIYNYVPVVGDDLNAEINWRNQIPQAAFTIIISGSSAVDPPAIIVSNTYYDLYNPPGIYIHGSVKNVGTPGNPGQVSITGFGGIYVYGSIEAGNLDIYAGGSFVQGYSDSFFNVGGVPRAHWGSLATWMQKSTQPYPKIWTLNYYKSANVPYFYFKWEQVPNPYYSSHYDWMQAQIGLFLSENNPDVGVIRGTNIFIAARYLNINGLIEAGCAAQELTLGAGVEELIEHYKAIIGGSSSASLDYKRYPLFSEGSSYRYYYDPVTDAIVLEQVAIRGGYIEMFGQIINTGAGKIRALDGYGTVYIDNQTGYDLILKGVDAGLGTPGRIVITDTAKKKDGEERVYLTTEYRRHYDPDTNSYRVVTVNWYTDDRSNIFGQTQTTGSTAVYDPVTGYRYVWVMGQSVMQEEIYTYRSASWLGIDWLVKDPANLYSVTVTPMGAPRLMPEGEYLVSQPENAGEAYIYWHQRRTELNRVLWGRREWSTQSWFLAPRYFYVEETYRTGYIDVYYHSIRADYPIDIEFAGGLEGSVYVRSNGDIILDGPVKNFSGDATLIAGRAIRSNYSAAITSRNIDLEAGTGIGGNNPLLIILGKSGILNAVSADGDIYIRENSGPLFVGQVRAPNGTARLEAREGITAAGEGSLIEGGLIDLKVVQGSIGSEEMPLRIDTGEGDGHGIRAEALHHIYLHEISGSLRVFSIHSRSGDITLKVPGGGLMDANMGNLVQNIDLLELWKLQGDYSAAEIRALLEKARRKRFTDTVYRETDPNLIGRHITLETGGNIGNIIALKLDFTDGRVELSEELRAILAAAEPGDVTFYDSDGNPVDPSRRGVEAAFLVVDVHRSIHVQANGVVTARSGGAVYLYSGADLQIYAISAGAGEPVRIKSAGSILNGAAAGVANIQGGEMVLEAARGSIGAPSAPVILQQGDADTLRARAAVGIYLEAGQGAGFSGFLNIDYIYTAGHADLQAAGFIRDANGDGRDNIRAASLHLRGDSIGEPDNFLEIDTAAYGVFDASAAGGGIFIEEVSGNLNAGEISARGDVILKAPGSILAFPGTGPSLIRGVNIILTAGGGIGGAGRDLRIDASSGGFGLLNASAPQNIYIHEVMGDLNLGLVKSNGDVYLRSAGSILSGGSINIMAGGFWFEAFYSVGTADRPLLTDVNKIEGSALSGPVHINNRGGLIIGDMEAATDGIRAGGAVRLTAAGPINVKESLRASGDIVLTALDPEGPGDHISVTGGVIIYASGGAITLQAGGDISLESGSQLNSYGPALLYGDYGGSGAAGTTITIKGVIRAMQLEAYGNGKSDNFILEGATFNCPVIIYGGAGNDTFTVNRLPSSSHAVNLYGQGGSNAYTLHISGPGTGYTVNIGATSGMDTLAIKGTEASEIFLLRAGYVAVRTEGDSSGRVQRVNYDSGVGLLELSGTGGSNRFYLDGTGAPAKIYGGPGDELFQVGQVFASTPPGVSTVPTTRGYLSAGVNHETRIYGEGGSDNFIVYSNLAPLWLYGGTDDDTFIVRAFILEDGKREVAYHQSAPLYMDGEAGYNFLYIIRGERWIRIRLSEGAFAGAGLDLTWMNMDGRKVMKDWPLEPGLGLPGEPGDPLPQLPGVWPLIAGGTGAVLFLMTAAIYLSRRRRRILSKAA